MTVANDRKAIVTGGASGFGLEISRRLCESGARVAIVDISQDHLAHATSALGPDVLPLQGDVRSTQSVREAVRAATAKFGGLDTLVISAGVIHIKPLEDV